MSLYMNDNKPATRRVVSSRFSISSVWGASRFETDNSPPSVESSVRDWVR